MKITTGNWNFTFGNVNQRDKLKFQEELIQAAFGFNPPNDPHDCKTGIDWRISLKR